MHKFLIIAAGFLAVCPSAPGMELDETGSVPAANAASRVEPGDAILGTWLTEEAKGKVEIYRETGPGGAPRYYGRITWVKWDYYLEGDPEEGKPVHDRENPDRSLRDRPIAGIVVLKDFVYNARRDRWESGTIYDPENGKTYRCVIRLIDDPRVEGGRRLDLRGYVGFRTFGRTTQWVPAPDTTAPERIAEEN
jgi:uncharacterized protein (DUF2147 family)